MTAEEQKRVDRKIAALEHQIAALMECVRFVASRITSNSAGLPDRSASAEVEQRLSAELATRPR